MKLKKLLVMSMVALSILMVGCQDDKNSSDKASTSSQVVSENMDINTYHETIPVPEEGWTAETLNKTIYINGKNVSFPFTIQDLGEGFEWHPEGFVLYETNNTAGNLILYNGQEFATAFVDATNKDKLAESKIKFLLNTAKGMNLLYINGVTIGSTAHQVIDALGEPTEVYDPEGIVQSLIYINDKFLIYLSFDDKYINGITIKMEDK
jgi:hypothetical protein